MQKPQQEHQHHLGLLSPKKSIYPDTGCPEKLWSKRSRRRSGPCTRREGWGGTSPREGYFVTANAFCSAKLKSLAVPPLPCVLRNRSRSHIKTWSQTLGWGAALLEAQSCMAEDAVETGLKICDSF